MTPEIFHNQGIALAQQNRLAEALALLDKALQLKPDYGEAHNNRGVILQQLNRMEEAVASYDRALRIRPDNPGTLYNRGNALVQLQRMEDAIGSYDGVLKLTPDHVESLLNRGYALMHLKRSSDALVSFEKALKIRPGYGDAHHNRGVVLANLGRLEEAVTSYNAALQLQPDHAAAHNDRGSALMALGHPEEAIMSFEKALQINPAHAEAHYNHGVALTRLGRPEDAIASFGRALQVRPDNHAARALKSHQQARICDWTSRARDAGLLVSGIDLDGVEPFLMLPIDDNPLQQLGRAKKWAERNYSPSQKIQFRAKARPEKLRIGYFSADFHDHPVMYLMARLFELHDRERFEVRLFSFGEDKHDALRQRAANSADQFHDVRGFSDGDIVDLARESKIDIAVDLMGYTKGSRTEIFSHRVAPLQVNYLGYPGTMGAGFMDYIIADEWIVPEADRRFYAEDVICLPHSYMANDNLRVVAEEGCDRTTFGLPEDGFVFCCFNNSYKISPAEFGTWMNLLAKVPGSVLWLSKDSDLAAANLAREAAARGIDPGRLVFAGRVPDHAEYLARYRCADLFLDTFNYNAHATASDVLWAGLPLVTKTGRSFPARVAGSLLHAVGMPELVTDTAEAYERLALDLATDPVRLAGVKAKLAANRLITPLFDSEAFTRDIESAYDLMYDRLPVG